MIENSAVHVGERRPVHASRQVFIEQQLEETWLFGAWDSASLTLTVDPFNAHNDFKTCARTGCENPAARRLICSPCKRAAGRAGVSDADFAMAHPKKDPLEARSTLGFTFCAVRDESDKQCGRAATTRGLCPTHHSRLAKRLRSRGEAITDDAIAEFVQDRTNKIVPPPQSCALSTCKRYISSPSKAGLCNFHQSGFRSARRRMPQITLDEYLASNAATEKNEMHLKQLSEPMRTELLFVLQQYSKRGMGRISLGKLRPFIREVATEPHTDLLECFRNHSHAVRLKGIRTFGIQVLEKAWRRFEGKNPLSGPLIFLQDLPLRETRSARNPDLAGAPLVVSRIEQAWLAETFRAWLGATLDTRSIVQLCFEMCVEASRELATRRADAGHDASRLSYSDMAAITSAFERRWTVQMNRQVLATWWDFCRVARHVGVWNDVPLSFAQNYAAQKRIAQRGRTDRKVESDRVTPTAVIAHLRRNTHLLDVGRHSEMYRCLLELLMETGRRPGEIVTLGEDCLVQDRHGGWVLKYVAHKTGGSTKELPVDSAVAKSVQAWKSTRTEKGINSPLLFPTPRRRLQDGNTQPVSERYIGKLLRAYISSLPPVPGTVTDIDGMPVNFDLSTVQPYDFRRAYAQRHADNGTDPDVLRQLMDHVSMSTTMGYYQVSSKRRRRAVAALAPLAHDRHGAQVGIGSGRIQLKITPVPYGDCAEPTNVAAGGTACQLRYQCAGCGFFRPNPSHIPEIEKELVKLRSQLRIAEASDTATYLLEAQRGLIADYENVLETMRQKLADLEPAQREEIRAMSEVLRRARGAALGGKRVEIREI